jgi:hypothetical protein
VPLSTLASCSEALGLRTRTLKGAGPPLEGGPGVLVVKAAGQGRRLPHLTSCMEGGKDKRY